MISSERRASAVPTTETDGDDFDNLLSAIGFGCWQTISVTMVLAIAALLPIQLVGVSLIAPPVLYRCYNESFNDTGSILIQNANYSLAEAAQEDASNTTDPFYNEKCLTSPNQTSQDWLPAPNTSIFTNMESCPYIEYDTSIFSSSVVSDFHLVCEKFPQQALYQIMYTIGGVLGSAIGGQIGDRWGRRKGVQIGSMIYLASILATAYVPLYEVILLGRVCLGFAITSTLVTGWNMVIESAPPKGRTLAGMLMGLPFSAFIVLFAAVGYFIRTWQNLILVCSTPILILIPLCFVVDESPRWLLQKNRGKEAIIILKKAIRLNKAKVTYDVSALVEKIIQKNIKQQPNNLTETMSFSAKCKAALHQMLEYFKSPGMRVILVVTPIIWFFQSFVYLGLAINANNFASSNPFLYVGLTGVMDAAAILISTPATPYLGRRVMVGVELFIGGVLLLVELIIPKEYAWSKWVLVMVGFLLVAGAFQVNFVYAPELFPTEARTRGFAFVNTVGGLGFLCAPLITTNLAQVKSWAPGVVFGASGILISLLVFLLPETRNKPLPENLQDVDDRWREGRRKPKPKGAGIENLAYRSDTENNL